MGVEGITPASAGKSFSGCHAFSSFWDHPRECGEKPALPRLMAVRSGSPPRVRGKGANITGNSLVKGITPASAGKRGRCCRDSRLCWDHPRECGEKAMRFIPTSLRTGSPPRVRGKVVPCVMLAAVSGITPASAGKRTRLVLYVHNLGDHPRECGEKRSIASQSPRTSGSPPRVRGKELQERYNPIKGRITPASAGKSYVSVRFVIWPRDHPRECGEKSWPPVWVR